MKTGSKRSLTRKILYLFGGFLLLLAISSWVFYRYYFEDTVNNLLTPKLQEVVRIATEGRFRLKIGKIIRHNGEFFCTDFELIRVRFDSAESGLTLQRLTEDTVYLGGINPLDLIRGKGAFISRMEMHGPKMFVTEVPPKPERTMSGPEDFIPKKMPDDLPVFSFDSIIISDMVISLPERYRPSKGDSLVRGASARLVDFRLDNSTLISEPLLYSKHADLVMPKLRFVVEEGLYNVQAGPISANLTDSLLTIDSAAYFSNYSEEEFAARHKYPRGKLDIRCANITLNGFDIEGFTEAKHLAVKKCTVGTWFVDYYCDKRKPHDPHPPAATMPNDVAREYHLPVDIDSLCLRNGRIRVRERVPGSIQAGVITIDHVKISAFPYCTDSSCVHYGLPTKISLSGLFLGEGPVTATVLIDFQHPTLDLRIDATVGKFSVKRLNEFLVPNERKEATDGTVEDGRLTMDIRNGVATTVVAPHYHHLSMKILPAKATAKEGLLEGIKTFVANNFVLHSPNMEPYAIVGKSTYHRKKEEEFLQFLWKAIRKSVGKVIGGFD